MVTRNGAMEADPSLRRLGASAGLAPIGVFLIWIGLQGWGGTPQEFWVSLAFLGGLAIGAGWIVAPFASGAPQRGVIVVAAYPLAAYLLYLPVALIGSLLTNLSSGTLRDPAALAISLIGLLAYGLISMIYFVPFLLPAGLAWALTFRLLRWLAMRDRAGNDVAPTHTSMAPAHEQPRRPIRPRRIGLISAGIIVGYGLFVAGLGFQSHGREPSPSWEFLRPVALAGLFAIPAVVAVIGILAKARTLVIAAGVICLSQAFITFSGVTLGFLVPAIVLLGLGVEEPASSELAGKGRSTIVAGFLVIALTVGAWVAVFGLTETRCWVATRATDGSLSYSDVPNSDTITLSLAQVAGGCDGGSLTVHGIGFGVALALGAVVSAVAGAGVRRERNRS